MEFFLCPVTHGSFIGAKTIASGTSIQTTYTCLESKLYMYKLYFKKSNCMQPLHWLLVNSKPDYKPSTLSASVKFSTHPQRVSSFISFPAPSANVFLKLLCSKAVEFSVSFSSPIASTNNTTNDFTQPSPLLLFACAGCVLPCIWCSL